MFGHGVFSLQICAKECSAICLVACFFLHVYFIFFLTRRCIHAALVDVFAFGSSHSLEKKCTREGGCVERHAKDIQVKNKNIQTYIYIETTNL